MRITGREVRPTNRHYASGIHDDSTAQAAGFRGGTIAGSAHLDTLVPLAVDLFGESWFRSGSISMTFRYATTDGEPTVASVAEEETVGTPGQHSCSVTRSGRGGAAPGSGHELGPILVGEGTLSSPSATGPSHLRQNPLRHDPNSLRILQSVRQFDPIGPLPDTIDAYEFAQRCEQGLITEPLEWYRTTPEQLSVNPFGQAIASPSAIIDSTNRVVSAVLVPLLPPAVGMWSALEVQFVRGPVFTGREYLVSGHIAALSDSPKTEVIWQDMTLSDDAGIVATVRVQSRFVKNTSPLWDHE
jgi:hypothetical protein